MRTQFWGGSQTAPSTTVLNFGSVVQAGRGFLTTESSAEQVCSVAGLIHSFRINLTTAPGVGKQWTFTVRKNGADTALQIVVSGTGKTGFIATAVTVAAGDRFAISIQPSGTPTLPGNISWASSFDSTNVRESPLLSCTFGTTMNVSNASNSVSVQGTNTSTTAPTNVDGIVPVAGSITGFRVRFPAAVAAGSWSVLLVKNGVDTALTATVTGGAQVATASGSAVAVVAGDLIRFRVPGSTTPVAQSFSVGATFAPTVDGNSFVVGGQLSLSNSSSLFYWNGASPDAGNATALNRNVMSNACALTAWYAQAKTTPVGGDSWTYNLLVNEVQVATVATTLANVVSSTGLNIAVADADRVEMGHVPAGAPAASISIWSVAVFVQPGVIATNESGEASALTGNSGFTGAGSTNESGEASALTGASGYRGPAGTNESGEASALTGASGFSGAASTNESGETSALTGFNGVQGVASTNQSGEASAATGAAGFSGDVETDSGGLTTAGGGSMGFSGDAETDSGGVGTNGAGISGFDGDVETDSGGVTTDGTGATGFSGDAETDSGGISTAGIGSTGFSGSAETDSGGVTTQGVGTYGYEGDVETDSAGITTDGTGTAGDVVDTVITNQAGLETSGTGEVGSAPVPPQPVPPVKEPAGWTEKFTRLRKRFQRKKVIVTVSIQGAAHTSSAGNTTNAVGFVGSPRPAPVPVVQIPPPAPVALVAPPAAAPVPAPVPAPKSFFRQIIPQKPKRPPAIKGRAKTNSSGISTRVKVEVGEPEAEMLLTAIMIMEQDE